MTFYETIKNGYQKFFNVRSRDLGNNPQIPVPLHSPVCANLLPNS